MARQWRLSALALVLIMVSPTALCEPAEDGAIGVSRDSAADDALHEGCSTTFGDASPGGPLAQAAPSRQSSRPSPGLTGSETVDALWDGPAAEYASSAPERRGVTNDPVRASPDVSPTGIDFIGPDPAIGKFGAAEVGKPTQFNVTVSNSGGAAAAPVSVRIIIVDYFGNNVGDYNTTIPSIAPGASATAYWKYWTPAFCTQFSVNATASASGDVNATNNTMLLTGLWADKWIDDCETSSGWTGDIGAGKWAITAVDPWPSGHSGPGSWHCGQANYYDNNTDLSIVSPPVDLSRMNPTYYILFNMNYHGRTSPGDKITVYITDDGGATWYDIFAPSLEGNTASNGWYDWVSHWEDYDGDGVVDPSEPHQVGLDISEFGGSTVKMRLRFSSDAEFNAEGFYIDDIVIRGWENQNDVALLDISAASVDMLGVEQTFNTTVQNLGQSPTGSFKAYFNISDGTSMERTVAAMEPGERKTLSWTWTPALGGNYTAQCTLLPDADEVAGDDSLWRPVHVAAAPAGTLLVDDDSGPGNNGALRGMTGADVEWAYKDALTFAEYDVYLVGDRDGPPLPLMQRYGLVIWVTGYDDSFSSRAGTLTASDRSSIASYMDGGGRLMLFSFETMWDAWTVWGDQEFVVNYLHVMAFGSGDDDLGMPSIKLVGVDGDPITGGLSLDPAAPPAGLWDKSDRLQNASDSPGIFYQNYYSRDPLSGPFNALRHEGKTKFVFLAFELSFIKNAEDRAVLMRRALEWLWGGAALAPGKGGVQGFAAPGQNITYNITLATTEQRLWRVDSLGPGTMPPGWQASCDMAVANGTPAVSVAPDRPLQLKLTVTVPPAEPAGSFGDVTVVARMEGSPFWVSIATRTTVTAVSGVELACARPVQTAYAGEELIFMVSVANTGNLDDRFDMSLRGEAASWCQLSRGYFYLSGGAVAFVQVAADLPSDARAGTHNLTVRAQASNGTEPARHELQLTIDVNATHNLKIEGSPPGQVVNMAESLKATVPVEIGNYGNVGETAAVSICATFFGWQQWQLGMAERELSPFERAVVVKLDVVAPASAAAGYYNITVRLGYGSGEQADKRNTVIELRIPDLSVSPADLRLSPSRPSPGANVEISASITNNGTAEARNISVVFTLNNKTAGTWRITEAVAPGQTVTASVFTKAIRYGDNLLSVEIDPGGGMAEASRENNVAQAHIFGYQPDLSLGPVTLHAVGRAQPRDNRTVSAGMVEVAVVVTNGGDFSLDADNIDVAFMVNGEIFETRIVSVGAGAQTTATALWFAKAGTSQLRIIVDPGNRTDEANEQNNEQVLTINVPAEGLTTQDTGLWVPIAGGIIAVAILAAAVAYRSTRSRTARPAPRPRIEGMRSYRAKEGFGRPCSKCKKPIEGGTGYLKCEECGARYHPECASAGICQVCAEKELETDG